MKIDCDLHGSEDLVLVCDHLIEGSGLECAYLLPHSGDFYAMICSGCLSRMINKQPAARQGDKVMEGGGGPNAIAAGFPSVLIGG